MAYTPTHYDVLGVHESATGKEIENAFLKLSFEQKDGSFSKLNEANAVLKDPIKRAAYDTQLGINKYQPKKKVLVFGQSGVGKSSMLNALLGVHLPVSGMATGCTFNSASVMGRENVCPKEGLDILFYDTVGLNEVGSGTTGAENSISALIQLLRSLKSGISLLIFVTRAPRITDITKKNYDLFVNLITNKKVPVICVVTGLENEESMPAWISQNQEMYSNAGMHFTSMIGTCFQVGTTRRAEALYAPAREESVKAVWDKILEKVAPEPINFLVKESFFQMVRRVVRDFFPSYKVVNERILQILISLGVAPDKAKALAAAPEFQN